MVSVPVSAGFDKVRVGEGMSVTDLVVVTVPSSVSVDEPPK
jgi:hypothetical protein